MTHGFCRTLTHNMYMSLHIPQPCLWVVSSLNKRAVRVVRSSNSPKASLICLKALLFHLAEVHSIGSWTGDKLLEAFHLFTCSCIKWVLMTSLQHNKTDANILAKEGTTLVPSLTNLSVSSFSGITCCPDVYTNVTFF